MDSTRRKRCPLREMPLPLDWLHRLQMMRMLSSRSEPPSECGMMWSASGLAGVRLMSQRSSTPQRGQCVSPSARARRFAVAALWIQFAVPVLDVVMRTLLLWKLQRY